MISERKLAANRRNASRSTGPRTARGKARSSRNATKHGLSGATIVLSRSESIRYRRRLAEWYADLRPVDEAGRALVERAVFASIVLDRIQSIPIYDDAGGFDPSRVRLVLRYERSWSRTFHRCLQALAGARAATPADTATNSHIEAREKPRSSPEC